MVSSIKSNSASTVAERSIAERIRAVFRRKVAPSNILDSSIGKKKKTHNTVVISDEGHDVSRQSMDVRERPSLDLRPKSTSSRKKF